jgi:hypothetical protein
MFARRDFLRMMATGASTITAIARPPASKAAVPIQTSGIPAPAAAAGFKTMVFHDEFESLSTIDMANSQATGFNWYRAAWFTHGRSAVDESNFSISNGVLKVGGGKGDVGYGLVSAFDNSTGGSTGTVFRNGGYFEASIRYDPFDSEKAAANGPAFWSIAVEHLIDNEATGPAKWPGQPDGYTHFIELDFMEPLIPPGKPYRGSKSYQGNIHDWYGTWNSRTSQWANNISNRANDVIWVGSVDWNEFQTYGLLWVPQSGSTPGYVTWYFNGKAMASIYWKGPPGSPPLPGEDRQELTPSSPRRATTTYSVLDSQGLALALSTATAWPMYVDWVKVWK